MKLYHGTSATLLPKILKNGIMPRGRRKGNWDKAPSRSDCVYLTDAYAPYFCFTTKDDKQKQGLVLEIDSEKIEGILMLPDEDAIEQCMRTHDNVPGNMQERTAHYRKNLTRYHGNNQWQISLQALGTCCVLGKVPASAITRVALIPGSYLWWWDASISLINYKILGAKYRAQTARLFGDKPIDPPTQDDDWKIEMDHDVQDVVNGALSTPKRIVHPDERTRWKELRANLEAAQTGGNHGP